METLHFSPWLSDLPSSDGFQVEFIYVNLVQRCLDTNYWQ
jgi:hypothetical protein